MLKYNADDMLEYNADDVLEYNADDMLEHNVTKHKHQKVLKFMRWHQTYNHQTQQCGASLTLTLNLSGGNKRQCPAKYSTW